jgi:capsular exopolysaccharide synthesis family protein
MGDSPAARGLGRDLAVPPGSHGLAATAAPTPAPRALSARLLFQYKWSILGLFVLVGGLAVGGIRVLLVPRYRATAIIEVSPVIPRLLAGQGDLVPLYESYRGSQADFITNPVVLNGVLDDAQVKQSRWYRATPASPLEALLDRLHLRSPSPPLDRLVAALEVEVPKGKQLVVVSLTATTPGEAQLIVDRILESYVRFTNERASTSEYDLMGKLRKEIGDRELELQGLEETAAQLRQQLGTDAPEELVRERGLGILRLKATVDALQTDLEVARRTLEVVPNHADTATTQPVTAVRADPNAGELFPTTAGTSVALADPSSAARYVFDPRWQQLSDRVAAARREVERRQERFNEGDPVLARLRREQAGAETELHAWESQLDLLGPRRPVDTGPTALRETVAQMTVRLELLTGQLETERQAARSMFADAEELSQKSAARARTDEMRQQLERRLDEMRLNREVAGLVRTFPAIEPTEPDNDRRWKLTAAALVGALAAGVGLAILRIKLSPTVDQALELSCPVQGVFLGYLPLRRSDQMSALDESPAQVESARMIRTALLNRLNGARGVTVQITSATVGSGKSTLAVVLARSLAQGGRRVLLVDTDMRRPTLAARFAIAAVPGLRDVLTGPDATAAIQRVAHTPGLSVLPAGALACHEERELMANGAFASLLHQWRGAYDLVLLDSAPLLGMADAGIIAGRVDGTVLVVRERYCRREAVLEALATLSAAGGKLLGTVFVGSGRFGGYGYGYAYSHGYSDEAPPATPASATPTAGGSASEPDAPASV